MVKGPAESDKLIYAETNFIKNNVLKKFMISYRQYPKFHRHNQTFDQQNKTYCFGIDIRLLFLVSIARTAGMNASVKRQGIRVN